MDKSAVSAVCDLFLRQSQILHTAAGHTLIRMGQHFTTLLIYGKKHTPCIHRNSGEYVVELVSLLGLQHPGRRHSHLYDSLLILARHTDILEHLLFVAVRSYILHQIGTRII